MSEPVVAIVGRPNVGKSTFFNRLIGRRQAIVDDLPGVTRDRNYADMEWNGQRFLLMDTGGYTPNSSDVFDAAVREQVEIALEEAQAIVLVVDVETGITATDQEIAAMLRASSKDVLVAVNKVDDKRADIEVGQFYSLGLGDPIPVSAMIGRQTGDFLDTLTELLVKHPVIEEDEDAIKLAVIGKENVGKSSLVNTFLNKDRQIVTDIPGTTRDSIDAQLNFKKRKILIIDTAGLKRKAKVRENILFYSTVRTHRSLQRCDVVIYMVSAPDGLSRQDILILAEAQKEGKGIILVMNKWDLVEKTHRTADEKIDEIRERIGELRYVPIIFTSVPEKKRLYKLLDLVIKVYEERNRRIPTAELNDFFMPILAEKTPPAMRGKEVKIKYVTQVRSTPPLFAFYCNHPDLLADHYKRFLENRLRAKFGFQGVPVKFSFRKK